MIRFSKPENPLEVLKKHLKTVGKKGAQPLLLSYSELLLGQSPPSLFQGVEGPALAAFLQDRFNFIATRPQGLFALKLSAAPALSQGMGEELLVLEVLVDDRPFFIDSIQAAIVAGGHRLHAVLHPIMHVNRGPDGVLGDTQDFNPHGAGNESHLFFLLGAIPPSARQALQDEVRAVLEDVIRCVDDFPRILDQVRELLQRSGGQDAQTPVARLIRWFLQDNFVFLGFQAYHGPNKDASPVPEPSHSWGLFSRDNAHSPHREALASLALRFIGRAPFGAPFFLVEETDVVSRMRHRSNLSALLISPEGSAQQGAAVIVGLFSNRSLRADVMEIPVVQEKLRAVMDALGIVKKSYRQREVLNFFTELPRYELFRQTTAHLTAVTGFFISVLDHPRVEVAQFSDEQTDTFRLIVSIPGFEFSHDRLESLRRLVDSLIGTGAQNVFSVSGPSFQMACLVYEHYQVLGRTLPDEAELGAAIHDAVLPRTDRLLRLWREQAQDNARAGRGPKLVASLPEAYLLAHEDGEVLLDLNHLDRLLVEETPQFDLRRASEQPMVKLILYAREKYSLSRIMPILSTLRVGVDEEVTWTLELPAPGAHLQTFLLTPPPGTLLDPEQHHALLRGLIFRILHHQQDNDPLNALLITCGFDWRRIALLRLYRNYLMQVGTVYTRRTIDETLIRLSRATQALMGVFQARFDPDLKGRETAMAAARKEMDSVERTIDNLTEDRIIKALYNLILSSERTNFFQDLENAVMAVKLASRRIEQLPSPRPLYEVIVEGPLMEGVHLRGDKVSRGGIRYSDRPDDFRTEVLGLMATQMKKNAFIVPLGSKGGFVVKSLAPYQGDPRKAGDEQYGVFIRALLSLTDNLREGQVVPPPRVVRHDEDDPYLVVAADKGTAHLSDTANKIAEETGFWLGDAFASGGSHGYDHKKVGITARGAWESVRRHFLELEVNVQTQHITAVGIGDMSGDVFGNGMLLTRTLKLLGAFDHRHIFLDPDPDAETSYAERKRLFAMPRSSWLDYDPSLISPGGGVWPRSAKEIPLSPQARHLLGTDQETLSGEALVHALLLLPVDLLWNGGIGTYVKSSAETHAEVGDPNNDAVRVNSQDLRCRVVGEGGNLGFTQVARIEFDQNGGYINTDAIDNAGGVNMSDHEVNLKILCTTLESEGKLKTRSQRNELLASLTEEVTQQVLRANYLQVLVLSMDRKRSKVFIDPFLRLVDRLAAKGGLDRRTESIPNAQRLQHSAGQGLPRPVLAVMLAYAKTHLYQELVRNPLVAEPFLQKYFVDYFPPELAPKFALESMAHPLRSQIIATQLTNRIVDQAGMTFVWETQLVSEHSAPEVVGTYLLCDALTGSAVLREWVYRPDNPLSARDQYRLLMDLEALLADMTRWILTHETNAGHTFNALPGLRASFLEYQQVLRELLPEKEREANANQAQAWREAGLDESSAWLAAQVVYLRGFLPARALTANCGVSLEQAVDVMRGLEQRLACSRIEGILEALRPTNTWQQQYAFALRRILIRTHQSLLEAVATEGSNKGSPGLWLEKFLAPRSQALKAYIDTRDRALSQDPPELVALGMVGNLLLALQSPDLK